MRNNILFTIIMFLIQPIFIIGLLFVINRYRKRVQYTRKTFRVNFNRENFEVKDFLIKGIIPGIVLSIILFIIGVPLTLEWYLIYQVIAIISLLIGGYRFIHPLFTFSLSTIVLYGLDFFGVVLPFERLTNLLPTNVYSTNIETINYNLLSTNTLFYVSLILLVSIFLIDTKNESKIYPILNASKRGKKVASYQKNMMWLLPLLIIVPGQVIQPFASWWPLLTIGETEYAFLLMPILTGFRFTVSTQLLEESTAKIQTDFRNLAFLGLLLFAGSYFIPNIAIISLVILFVFGLIILIRHRRRENQWSFRYGPTNEGLRVIAVRLDSPAERMNLAIGDIILEINETEMINKETYNEALAYNRSYIKMRVRRKDGEIVIAQTPLYDNDFNNLGLLILDN